jgi:mannose-binding lectin 2
MGPVFGNRDNFNGLGIFFDTYANGRRSKSFPYIMAMMGNGDGTTYDNDNDGERNELAGCESKFRGSNVPTRGRLIYDSDQKTVNV